MTNTVCSSWIIFAAREVVFPAGITGVRLPGSASAGELLLRIWPSLSMHLLSLASVILALGFRLDASIFPSGNDC